MVGIGAPKNTPAELIETLNKEVNISIADPKFEARLTNLAGTVLSGSPADFGKLISDETNKWGKVICCILGMNRFVPRESGHEGGR
jgi:tripartite-type tricarboxylate transporter receptor subunit TctC